MRLRGAEQNTGRAARALPGRSLLALALLLGALAAPALPLHAQGEAAPEASMPPAPPPIAPDDLRPHIESLAALPSRVVGQPGHAEAARYVRRQLEALAPGRVRAATFPVVMPVEQNPARLTFLDSGETLRLHPLWPNGVRTCTTPPTGLTGHLLDAGDGSLSHYNDRPVRDAIVLMDFNSTDLWVRAGELGARAVLFIESPRMTREECEQKFLLTPIDLPRFLVDAETGAALRRRAAAAPAGQPVQVRLDAWIQWEEVLDQNFVAFIPGTDPERAQEAVLLSAYYDAMSVVPSLAPGAEQASGIAALLAIGERLAADPPRRTTVLLATSSHFNSLLGITWFAYQGTYSRANPDRALAWPELGIDFDRWFFLGLDLTTGTSDLAVTAPRRFNFFRAGPDENSRKVLRGWGREVSDLAAAWGAVQDPPVEVLDGINQPRGLRLDARIPGKVALDAEAVQLRGDTPAAFITIDDPRTWFDSPHDLPENVNFNNLASQATVLLGVARSLTDGESFPDRVTPRRDRMGTIKGETLLAGEGGAMVSDIPLSGALVNMRHVADKTWRGVRISRRAISAADGGYSMPGFEQPPSWGTEWTVRTEAYFIDPRTGVISYAPEQGETDNANAQVDVFINREVQPARAALFPCVPVNLYGLLSAKDFRVLENLSILDADSNVPPMSFGFFTPWRGPWYGEPHMETTAVAFLPERARFKVFARTGLGEPTLLLVNTDPDDEAAMTALGQGYVATRDLDMPFTAFASARDMTNIIETRVDTFEDNGIFNEHLSNIVDRLDEMLEKAEAAADTNRPAHFRAQSRESWAVAAKDYPSVKRTADDMIVAVMFYMALLVPFAVFTERLLIGAINTQRRLAWSTIIFTAVFIAFRYIHPAFDLTFTPVLILLAFIIFVLSVLVTVIVLTKFEDQFRKIREELGEVHQADVGRFSASVGAFGLGVSHLRNRPVRTALTCTTLILLTFILLSFTSISTYLGFFQREQEGTAHYNGFLLADPAGRPLHPSILEDVQLAFPDAVVSPRVWEFPSSPTDLKNGNIYFKIEPDRPAENPARIRAFVRVHPREQEAYGFRDLLTAGRWFETGESNAALIPAPLAEEWGFDDPLAEPRTFRVRTTEYRVVGVFDPEALGDKVDLDGYPPTPIDYSAPSPALYEMKLNLHRQDALRELLAQADIPHIAPDEVCILSASHTSGPFIPPTIHVPEQDGWLASIAVAFPSVEAAEEGLRRFASRTSLILFAGLDGELLEFSSHTGTSVQGLTALLVPLLISALIVFNTMLGAVHERRGEISVYNAMGLSPVHIGFLFLGEACVYAIMSIVIGYLVGQGAGQLISFLNLMPGLTLNYSALSAVWTSSLVAFIVIGSSLYPATIGAKMAVPTTDRRWKLPEAVEDQIDIPLPFTVVEGDAGALAAYLYEFVEAHVEYQMGNFYASHLRLDRDGPAYVVRTRMWLAPYDLGVSQILRLVIEPSELEGFHRVKMVIERLEGDVVSWRRTNTLFVKTLRKQFLLWRTLAPNQKDRYRTMVRRIAGQKAGKNAPAGQGREVTA